jgi:hypothetical protein
VDLLRAVLGCFHSTFSLNVGKDDKGILVLEINKNFLPLNPSVGLL